MLFKTGDAVVHPIRGAGIVMSVEERKWHGGKDRYYRIRLLGHPSTKLMIPTTAARQIGLRRAISKSKLGKLWHVLHSDPRKLPGDHKERYQVLKDRLATGDVFQVAEVVRDMAWRQHRENRLTTVGKQLYKQAIRLLAGEIAVTLGVGFEDAEVEVRQRLLGSPSLATVQ